jgi:hypothetical protein
MLPLLSTSVVVGLSVAVISVVTVVDDSLPGDEVDPSSVVPVAVSSELQANIKRLMGRAMRRMFEAYRARRRVAAFMGIPRA